MSPLNQPLGKFAPPTAGVPSLIKHTLTKTDVVAVETPRTPARLLYVGGTLFIFVLVAVVLLVRYFWVSGHQSPLQFSSANDAGRPVELAASRAGSPGQTPVTRAAPDSNTRPVVTTRITESDVRGNRARRAEETVQPGNSPSRRWLLADEYAGRLSSLAQEGPDRLGDERLAEMDRLLRQLARLGPAAVPAISELLREGWDIDFHMDGEPNSKRNPLVVEYDSLRLGLFDLLRKIGGESANSVLYDELGSTTRPVEIRVLADYLDEYAPGLYAQEVVEVANDVLGMKSEGLLPDDDVGPLFHTLEKFGDEIIVPILEENISGQWGRYAAIALGGVAGGAGIPVLSEIVARQSVEGTPDGRQADTRLVAVRVLAQAAADDREAASALLEHAKNGRISSSAWPAIASALAGDDQLQVEKPEIDLTNVTPYSTSKWKKYPYNAHTRGESVIYSVHRSANLTDGEIADRVALIGRLIEVAKDPNARSSLMQSQQYLRGMRK